jgi:7-cyano-7-deazaguanine synthase
MAVPVPNRPDCAAILSGGLDSTTLVYHLRDAGFTPHCISFNYGQRHYKELDFAWHTAERLSLGHSEIDLTSVSSLISSSALTYGTDVPEGHYAEDNMKATVVPNRNMIMLAIAAAVAVSNSYKFVAAGMHAGDHFVYPDCRPGFILTLNEAILLGNDGFHSFEKGAIVDANGIELQDSRAIFTPFINWTKTDIAARALQLNVPLDKTWSCYKGGEYHCGRCGTCVERLEAINEAQERLKGASMYNEETHRDLTYYEDATFWKTVTKEQA